MILYKALGLILVVSGSRMSGGDPSIAPEITKCW